MAFTLPALPYDFDALEPHIQTKTMEINNAKHQQADRTNGKNAKEPETERGHKRGEKRQEKK